MLFLWVADHFHSLPFELLALGSCVIGVTVSAGSYAGKYRVVSAIASHAPGPPSVAAAGDDALQLRSCPQSIPSTITSVSKTRSDPRAARSGVCKASAVRTRKGARRTSAVGLTGGWVGREVEIVGYKCLYCCQYAACSHACTCTAACASACA
ncbi:hypothetical protein BD311DRAFT_407123 [Dichomitus squalens]|uniref:Uncharacterized protein n=1 Tax=Dichomitus squalens TaxID=114155 RepID=A0A4Q9MHR6_9APHY|nr:hypothetical protein BD311DRAFT_407123 [Dichomitus squalens]